MCRATVEQVVTVHRGDDDVVQADVAHGFGEMRRLHRVKRVGATVADVAEGAAAGADVAHDHEGGGVVAKAFADVRAGGFFADAVQFLLAHDGFHPPHFFATGELCAYPARFAQAFFADVAGVFGDLADFFRPFFLHPHRVWFDAHGDGLFAVAHGDALIINVCLL